MEPDANAVTEQVKLNIGDKEIAIARLQVQVRMLTEELAELRKRLNLKVK